MPEPTASPAPDARTRPARRGRPVEKLTPTHARVHNRALVLQQLFVDEPLSRAEIARATGLTRVTASEIVGDLIAEGYIRELADRQRGNIGKPATLLRLDTERHHVLAIDLSDEGIVRGAVATLGGDLVERRELAVGDARGEELVDRLIAFAGELRDLAPAAVVGIGIGSPGVIDADGRVLEAPNRGWRDEPLAARLTDALGIPAHVGNDADISMLGEYTFGEANPEGAILVTVGSGVGSGIMLDGALVRGAERASGEIGHVRVVEVGALRCACGRFGCLETVLSARALRAALDGGSTDAGVAAAAGRALGLVLAPVISALNLVDVVLSGPEDLLGDSPIGLALRGAVHDAIAERTLPAQSAHVVVRGAALGRDVVLRGAAVLVLSARLGIS